MQMWPVGTACRIGRRDQKDPSAIPSMQNKLGLLFGCHSFVILSVQSLPFQVCSKCFHGCLLPLAPNGVVCLVHSWSDTSDQTGVTGYFKT